MGPGLNDAGVYYGATSEESRPGSRSRRVADPAALGGPPTPPPTSTTAAPELAAAIRSHGGQAAVSAKIIQGAPQPTEQVEMLGFLRFAAGPQGAAAVTGSDRYLEDDEYLPFDPATRPNPAFVPSFGSREIGRGGRGLGVGAVLGSASPSGSGRLDP